MEQKNTGPPIKKVKAFLTQWARGTATNLGVAGAAVVAVLFATLLSPGYIDSPVAGDTSQPIEEVLVIGKMPDHLVKD